MSTSTLPIPTTDDMLKEARRELAMRERVYPRWVSAGTMSQKAADWQTHCQRAIVKVLEEQATRERLI